jgi:hypothetical protein
MMTRFGIAWIIYDGDLDATLCMDLVVKRRRYHITYHSPVCQDLRAFSMKGHRR